MPIRALSINELLMLLAVDDREGTIHWQATPYLNYALAGGMVAELAGRGCVSIDADGHLRVDRDGPTGSALLDQVVATLAAPAEGQSLQSAVAALASGFEDLPHRQLEEMAERGVLERHDDTLLFLFHRTRYPARDSTPEKQLVAEIRRALLEGGGPVEPRLAALITLAHAAHLLAGPLNEEELDACQPRIASLAGGEAVSDAACSLIQDAERSLFVASSIPFMGMPQL